MKNFIIVGLIALVIGLIGGYAIGWGVYHQDNTTRPSTEHSADSSRQRDGSLIIEKVVDTFVTPAQIIPKNVYVERIIKVTVTDTMWRDPVNVNGELKCPPCTTQVDLSIVKDKKKNERRVIASSPDGTVVAGIDVPIEESAPVKKHPWTIGVSGSYDVINNTKRVGAYIDRTVGPFRIGGELGGWKEQAYLGARVGVNF